MEERGHKVVVGRKEERKKEEYQVDRKSEE